MLLIGRNTVGGARVPTKARQVSLTTTRVVIIMIGFGLVKPMREMAARCSNFREQGEMQSTRIALGWAAGSVNPNKWAVEQNPSNRLPFLARR